MRTIFHAACVVAVVTAVAFAGAEHAWAQLLFGGSGSSGSSFTSGTRTSPMPTTGTLSAGSRTASSGGFNQQFTTGTGSGTGLGTTGTELGAGGTGEASFVLDPATATRAVRGAQPQGNFVGTSAADIQGGFVGQVQAGANEAVGASGAQGQFQQQRGAQQFQGFDNRLPSQQQTPTGSSGVRAFRPVHRVNFTYSPPSPAVVAGRLQEHVGAPMNVPGSVTVRLEGRTAILEGAVASEHDRLLAETVARMEPGVDVVQNRLAIRTTPLPAR